MEEVLVQHRLLTAGYGTNFVVKYTNSTHFSFEKDMCALKKTVSVKRTEKNP